MLTRDNYANIYRPSKPETSFNCHTPWSGETISGDLLSRVSKVKVPFFDERDSFVCGYVNL
jgi:hypothetical protein